MSISSKNSNSSRRRITFTSDGKILSSVHSFNNKGKNNCSLKMSEPLLKSSDGFAIFTNNSDDVFGNNDDLFPSFQIESGTKNDTLKVDQPANITKGVNVEYVSELKPKIAPAPPSPVDGPMKFSDDQTGTPPDSPRDDRDDRSDYSKSSDKTIEMSPVKRPSSIQPSQSKRPEPNLMLDELLNPSKMRKMKEDVQPAANPVPELYTKKDDILNSPLGSMISSPETVKHASIFNSERERSSDRSRERDRSAHTQSQSAPAAPIAPEAQKMREEDEKLELLLKLRYLEQNRGVVLSKTYRYDSPIEDLRMEYALQQKNIDTREGVKTMRQFLVGGVTGVEYLNRRFDPIGAKLDGWSESVIEGIYEYDGIFERLHEKYQGSGKMEPEVELIGKLVMSAVVFHMTKAFFGNIAGPQFDNVLRERPGLVQEIFNAAKESERRTVASQQQGPMPANMALGTGLGEILNAMGFAQPSNNSQSAPTGQAQVHGAPVVQLPPGMTAADPLPRPFDTKQIPEPAVNEMYRQMTSGRDYSDDVRSITSEGKKSVTITTSPNGKRSVKI